jgi:magnesium chelatase family protein
MNPCPCGYFGTDACRCKETEVKKYQSKISGPILDRIDLQVELARLSLDERFAQTSAEESEGLRERIEMARELQIKRFDGKPIPFNAAIPGGHVRELCNFSERGLTRYKEVVGGNSLSTRSMDRLAKVARTVADLCGNEAVEPEYVDKAASFVVGGVLREAF